MILGTVYRFGLKLALCETPDGVLFAVPVDKITTHRKPNLTRPDKPLQGEKVREPSRITVGTVVGVKSLYKTEFGLRAGQGIACEYLQERLSRRR